MKISDTLNMTATDILTALATPALIVGHPVEAAIKTALADGNDRLFVATVPGASTTNTIRRTAEAAGHNVVTVACKYVTVDGLKKLTQGFPKGSSTVIIADNYSEATNGVTRLLETLSKRSSVQLLVGVDYYKPVA